MLIIYFHPQIQNCYFIHPFVSAGGNVWGLNTDTYKEIFSSSYLSIAALGLTLLPLQWEQYSFPRNDKMIVALTGQTQ
jgi:hypothetical protein